MGRIRLQFKGDNFKTINLFRTWYRNNFNSRNFVSGGGDSMMNMLLDAINYTPRNCAPCPPCPPLPPGPTIFTAEKQGFSVTTYGTIDI